MDDFHQSLLKYKFVKIKHNYYDYIITVMSHIIQMKTYRAFVKA